jgi:hypothetical protein
MTDRAALRDDLANQRLQVEFWISDMTKLAPPSATTAHLLLARAVTTSALVNLTVLEAAAAADEAHRAQGDALLSAIAGDPVRVTGQGVTLQLPEGFTAGEVREVLREIADLQTPRLATPWDTVRRFLLQDDRLAWAIAGARSHTSPDSDDERMARDVVALLSLGTERPERPATSEGG